MTLQRAAAAALECAERVYARGPDGDRFPTLFDYLSWADAYSVHRPEWPERLRILHLRREALGRVPRTQSAALQSSDVLDAALCVVAADARLGYPAARHVMQFPRNLGFCEASAVQCGDVFSRAVLLGALLTARSSGVAVDDDLVSDGIEYLVRSRRRAGSGGWAYFPGLIELAPDADTLAQVAQVFALAARCDLLRRYVVPQLDRIAAAQRPDGSFDTWMYDSTPEVGAIQRQWATQAWGTAADPEVVANVVIAARQVDASRYALLIDRAQSFLAGVGSRGVWEATWYHGPFYGTFVAVRALAGSRHAAAAFPRTLAWILDAQRDDGGWGWSGRSDPLSTALAISTVALLEGGVAGRSAIDGAMRYLRNAAESGTFATDVPFIRMNFGRARGEGGPIASFGAASVTAAYVLTTVASVRSSNGGAHAIS